MSTPDASPQALKKIRGVTWLQARILHICRCWRQSWWLHSNAGQGRWRATKNGAFAFCCLKIHENSRFSKFIKILQVVSLNFPYISMTLRRGEPRRFEARPRDKHPVHLAGIEDRHPVLAIEVVPILAKLLNASVKRNSDSAKETMALKGWKKTPWGFHGIHETWDPKKMDL